MDDDDDDGAPPVDARVRKWTNPSGTEALTQEERARFDIEGQRARRQASLAAAGLMVTEQPAANGSAIAQTPPAPQQSPSSRVLELLVAKFPEFSPEWPPELQIKWFEAYEKLLARGAMA